MTALQLNRSCRCNILIASVAVIQFTYNQPSNLPIKCLQTLDIFLLSSDKVQADQCTRCFNSFHMSNG